MEVPQLLAMMDVPFVVNASLDFLKNKTALKNTYALIDEESLPLKEFLRIVAIQQGTEALIGAAVTIIFIRHCAELKEMGRRWLSEGLLSQPNEFFVRQAAALVHSPADFVQRAQHIIDVNAVPFKEFLAAASDHFGIGFATGACTVVELLLRSEEVGRISGI